MTVSYYGRFWKNLLRWHGSLWKTVARSLAIYLIIFYIINFSIRYALKNEKQIDTVWKVKNFCMSQLNSFPLEFLLGFYVNLIVSRFWNQWSLVLWPDRFVLQLVQYVQGDDERTRVIRRTIARWVNLAQVLFYQGFALRTFRRFPTIDHIVRAGLMTPNEKSVFDSIDSPYGKPWLPIVWCENLLKQLEQEGKITNYESRQLAVELVNIRDQLAVMSLYDWVKIPLVYTQVVTVATFLYFAIALIAHQIVPQREVDYYFPFFIVIKFLFYMGWLKVGEDLNMPFGEDDDDFELNWIIDRNLSTSLVMADEAASSLPDIEGDQFHTHEAALMPYTAVSLANPGNHFKDNLIHIKMKEKQMEQIPIGHEEEYMQKNTTCYRCRKGKKKSPPLPTKKVEAKGARDRRGFGKHRDEESAMVLDESRNVELVSAESKKL